MKLPLTLHFTYFILASIGCFSWKYESKYIDPKQAIITILVLGVIQIALTILLLSIRPKSNMVLKERWKMTFISFCDKTHFSPEEAKYTLEKTYRYYERKRKKLVGKLKVGIIVSLLINVISSKDFQIAFFQTDFGKMWDANPLGVVVLLVFGVFGIYYLYHYQLPLSWLKYTLNYSEKEK